MRVERLLNLKIIRWERDNQKENIRMLFVFSIRLNGFPRPFSETQRFSEDSETLSPFTVPGNSKRFSIKYIGNAIIF